MGSRESWNSVLQIVELLSPPSMVSYPGAQNKTPMHLMAEIVWRSEIPFLTLEIFKVFIKNKNKIFLDMVSISGKNFFHYFFSGNTTIFDYSLIFFISLLFII